MTSRITKYFNKQIMHLYLIIKKGKNNISILKFHKLIFFLVLFLFPVKLVLSDGPAFNFETYFFHKVFGGNPVSLGKPKKSDEITLVTNIVRTFDENVVAIMVLKNETSKTISLEIAFPLELFISDINTSSYHEWSRYYYDDEIKNGAEEGNLTIYKRYCKKNLIITKDDIVNKYKFKQYIDGKEVDLNLTLLGLSNDEKHFSLNSKITFKPNEIKYIEYYYYQPFQHKSFMYVCPYDSYEFYYIVGTGSYWKNKINYGNYQFNFSIDNLSKIPKKIGSLKNLDSY